MVLFATASTAPAGPVSRTADVVLTVGLTGNIGAGKSTVAELLVAHGARLVDADRVAREVVEPGAPAYQPLVDRFGTGHPRRRRTHRPARALAEVVFGDPADLADLNAIIHPAIGIAMIEGKDACDGTDDIVVMDIPLLRDFHRETAGARRRGRGRRPVRSVRWSAWSASGACPRTTCGPGMAAQPTRAGAAGGRRLRGRQLRRRRAPGRRGGPGVGRAASACPGTGAGGPPAGPDPPTGWPGRGCHTRPVPSRACPPSRSSRPSAPPATSPRPSPGWSRDCERGDRYQTLLGITGSGKTATIAWTIEAVQRPTLIIEPNKSLAAQLAAELKEFFPRNRVEYFVSYYDYYQPEAYVPSSDTYIEKDSSINDEIDRLRHASTSSLLLRPDTIVVASVSCIYGLGSPDEYRDRIVALDPGEEYEQRALLRRLVELQYSRNDVALTRGQFRVHGDTVEIHPAYESAGRAHRVLRRHRRADPALRRPDRRDRRRPRGPGGLRQHPLRHGRRADAPGRARHRGRAAGPTGRAARTPASSSRPSASGCAPSTTSRCWPRPGCAAGWRTTAATSTGGPRGRRPSPCSTSSRRTSWSCWTRATSPCPQLRGQYAGDRSRKETLVDHGFRLPSAMDNRPLRFEEFIERVGQVILLSATPGPWELEHSANVVEQVIRPTGLVDPEVDIVPTTGQIDDLRAAHRRHRGRRLPGAGDHPHQEDGRGPHRLPGRAGRPGPVPALRRRHHGPDRAAARASPRRLRRPGGHQPPARGARPPRGGPGGHPRRRQGGLPAVGLVADPDHGPGRPQRQRPGGDVRRHR